MQGGASAVAVLSSSEARRAPVRDTSRGRRQGATPFHKPAGWACATPCALLGCQLGKPATGPGSAGPGGQLGRAVGQKGRRRRREMGRPVAGWVGQGRRRRVEGGKVNLGEVVSARVVADGLYELVAEPVAAPVETAVVAEPVAEDPNQSSVEPKAVEQEECEFNGSDGSEQWIIDGQNVPAGWTVEWIED